jgi:hypothetical protein
MMIPIQQHGIFQGVRGLDEAFEIAGISDIQITAEKGQVIAPAPEGASYLGFIFAHGYSVDAVESSLRTAHRRLAIDVRAEFPISRIRA